MNNKTLTLTFGSIIATAITASPIVLADTNPFGMKDISQVTVLAEADTEKAKEGKFGAGKMGAKKMSEGKCGAGKMPEAKCGADKK